MDKEYKLDVNRLKELRHATGFSMREISEKIGISESSYIQYESDKNQPGINALGKMADYFGVPVDYLIGRINSRSAAYNFKESIRKLKHQKIENYYKCGEIGIIPSPEAPYPYNLLEEIRFFDSKGRGGILSYSEMDELEDLISTLPDEHKEKIRRLAVDPFPYILTPEQEENLEKALKTLTEREQKVLEIRFKEGLTLKETGQRLGVTRERIRQIEAKALRKLRHPSRSAYIIKGPKMIEQNKAYCEELEAIIAHYEELRKYYIKLSSEINVFEKSEYNIDIEEMEFSRRTYNALKRAGINTVKDITEKTEIELMLLRNLGKRSFDEIRLKLYKLGLKLKDDEKVDENYSLDY